MIQTNTACCSSSSWLPSFSATALAPTTLSIVPRSLPPSARAEGMTADDNDDDTCCTDTISQPQAASATAAPAHLNVTRRTKIACSAS
jgi:hypothetical protein